MKLTRRQQLFLDKLLDLYHQAQAPIHYSLVGEKLGVNRFSAYDMLKLLERKGYVASQYVLAEGHAGPGRSSIAFYPTPKARAAVRLLAGRSAETEEWNAVKERILSRLRERPCRDDELLSEILHGVADIGSPLIYCTEMITALLLNLRLLRERAAELNPLRGLSTLLPAGPLGLGTLAGLSLGSLLAKSPDAVTTQPTVIPSAGSGQVLSHALSSSAEFILSNAEGLTVNHALSEANVSAEGEAKNLQTVDETPSAGRRGEPVEPSGQTLRGVYTERSECAQAGPEERRDDRPSEQLPGASLFERLLTSTRKYQTHLQSLSEEQVKHLSDFAQEVMAALEFSSD